MEWPALLLDRRVRSESLSSQRFVKGLNGGLKCTINVANRVNRKKGNIRLYKFEDDEVAIPDIGVRIVSYVGCVIKSHMELICMLTYKVFTEK